MLAFLHTGLASKILSFGALLSAVAVEWMLVNVPVSEISGQFPPATVRARDEIVTFASPAAVTGDSFLFEYAQETESEKILLDAFFDRAQLSDTTVAALKSLQVPAPITPGVIAHLTSNVGSGSCATKLRVEPAGGQFSGMQLSQSGDDISSDYRALGVRLFGADALVTLTPQGAFQHGLSPCKVGLSVGDWKQSTEGFCLFRSACPPENPSVSTGEISLSTPPPGRRIVRQSLCCLSEPRPTISSWPKISPFAPSIRRPGSLRTRRA